MSNFSENNILPRRRSIVVVLGMHRSGTSISTHVLSHLGVSLSKDLLAPSVDNERGFFESVRILDIHQEILKTIGSGAAHSLTRSPWPSQWWKLPELRAAKNKLRDIVIEESREPEILWGFKDPRTAILLPLWQDVFTAAGAHPIYFLTLRQPREVAASLKVRNQIPESLSELLWREHYLEATLRFSRYSHGRSVR